MIDIDETIDAEAEELQVIDIDRCSMVSCELPSTQECDPTSIVVDLTTPLGPITLCADHGFERLAAMSLAAVWEQSSLAMSA